MGEKNVGRLGFDRKRKVQTGGEDGGMKGAKPFRAGCRFIS